MPVTPPNHGAVPSDLQPQWFDLGSTPFFASLLIGCSARLLETTGHRQGLPAHIGDSVSSLTSRLVLNLKGLHTEERGTPVKGATGAWIDDEVVFDSFSRSFKLVFLSAKINADQNSDQAKKNY